MSIFSDVPIKKLKKNKFNLTHMKVMTFNMGDLVPIYLEEVLPGDSFKYDPEYLLKFMPLATPVFDMMDCFIEAFFVPARLTMPDNDWNNFISGGEDQEDTTYHPRCRFNAQNDIGSTTRQGTLYDYFGLPIPENAASVNVHFSQLPFRAYQLIWNEYYRDVDLQSPVDVLGTADDITSISSNDWGRLYSLKKRAKRKDYFTSARPEAQKGEEVGIPVDFVYADTSAQVRDLSTNNLRDMAPTEHFTSDASGNLISSVDGNLLNIENLETEGVSVSINELRTAVMLQQFYELMSRIGGRINEWLLGVFGVRSQDSRLQRPEYLGGSVNPVSVSEVLQTSQSDTTPQGTYSGYALSAGQGKGFTRTFPEHGYVIVLMSVIPRQGYHQGVEKLWHRYDRFDYYLPQFANLGEQEIKMSELYYDTTLALGHEDNEQVFGYAPRYAEYKWKRSTIHGEMHDTLENFHMQEHFASAPTLNQTFIQFDANTLARCFADTSTATDKLYCQVLNKVSALRPMPYYGVPGVHRI